MIKTKLYIIFAFICIWFSQNIISSDNNSNNSEEDTEFDDDSLKNSMGIYPIFSRVPEDFYEKYGILNDKTPIKIVDDSDDDEDDSNNSNVLFESQNFKQFKIKKLDDINDSAYLACKVGYMISNALESSINLENLKNDQNFKKLLLEDFDKKEFLKKFDSQNNQTPTPFNAAIEKILIEYYLPLPEKKYTSKIQEEADKEQQEIVTKRVIPSVAKKLANSFTKSENGATKLVIDKSELYTIISYAFVLNFQLNELNTLSLMNTYFPNLKSIDTKLEPITAPSDNIKLIIAYLKTRQNKSEIKFVEDMSSFNDTQLSKELTDEKSNLKQILVVKLDNRWITCVIYKKEKKIEYFFADPTNQNIIENKEISAFINKILIKPRQESEPTITFSVKKEETPPLNLNQKKVTRQDLPGSIPQAITEFIDCTNNPEKYLALSKDPLTVNLLLHGAPGTGKTTLAQFIADETNSEFISKTASSFMNSFQGNTEKNMENLFKEANQKAKNNRKVVIFIDEIDRLVGNNINDTNGTTQRLLAALLKELDTKKDNIICIFATNNIKEIPSVIKTRNIKEISVGLPAEPDRAAILKFYIKRDKVQTNNFDKLILNLAEETDGLSRREIRNLVSKAALIAAGQKADFIQEEDFYNSVFLIQENNKKLPNYNNRLSLHKYFFKNCELLVNERQYDIHDDVIKFMAKESEGLTTEKINEIVNKIVSVGLKHKPLIEKSNFFNAYNPILALYYNDKIIENPKYREGVLTYYFGESFNKYLTGRSSIKLDLGNFLEKIDDNNNYEVTIPKDFVEQTVGFTAKQIKDFMTEAFNMAQETGTISEYELYVALGKEQRKVEKEHNLEIAIEVGWNNGPLYKTISVKDKYHILPSNNMLKAMFKYYLSKYKHNIPDQYIGYAAQKMHGARCAYNFDEAKRMSLFSLEYVCTRAAQDSFKQGGVLTVENLIKTAEEANGYFPEYKAIQNNNSNNNSQSWCLIQ